MKVVLVKPGQKAEITEIGDKLEDMQRVVNGDIEAIYPFEDDVVLVCNEEGKFNGCIPNRALVDENDHIYDVVYGTFFICGLGKEDFDSLTDELAEKYRALMDTQAVGLAQYGWWRYNLLKI